MDKKFGISIIMPALNEENNIVQAISNSLQSFDSFGVNGEIIVINDGSTDRTSKLIADFMKKDSRVRTLNHASPKGIGASFWDGVDNALGEVVVMLPGDNENDSVEIMRYYKLLEHVDIVIPFIFNREARSTFRNALSFFYRFIINTTFLVNFNYTNGTILYRKSILKELENRSSGFFFQTDILIRTVKKGYIFAEVPYKLGLRKSGASKAVSFPSLLQVAKGYLHLIRDFYFKNGKSNNAYFVKDSQTAKRRANNK